MAQDERPGKRRTGSTATDEDRDAAADPRFSLSLGQVVASSLAAASAAAIASLFGVAGTIIGTALFSVVATVATALYEHAGRRTAERLAHVSGPLFERPQRSREPSGLPWRRIGIGAALVFAVAFAGITVFELLAGKPLSAMLGRNSDTGTTVQRVLPAKPKPSSTPSPSTPSSQPSPSSTSAPTPTGSSSPAPAGTPTGVTPSSPTRDTTPTGFPTQPLTPTATPGTPTPGTATATPTTAPPTSPRPAR